ncbi:hypothetical protein Efla_006908 [Eimeria flavescens]
MLLLLLLRMRAVSLQWEHPQQQQEHKGPLDIGMSAFATACNYVSRSSRKRSRLGPPISGRRGGPKQAEGAPELDGPQPPANKTQVRCTDTTAAAAAAAASADGVLSYYCCPVYVGGVFAPPQQQRQQATAAARAATAAAAAAATATSATGALVDSARAAAAAAFLPQGWVGASVRMSAAAVAAAASQVSAEEATMAAADGAPDGLGVDPAEAENAYPCCDIALWWSASHHPAAAAAAAAAAGGLHLGCAAGCTSAAAAAALQLPDADTTPELRAEAKEKLLQQIEKDAMAPLYRKAVEEFGWTLDEQKVKNMEAKHAEELAAIEAKLADAKENYGDTEVRDGLMAKAELFCRIGDVPAAIEAYDVAYQKTVGIGSRLDITLTLLRIGFVFNDRNLLKKSLQTAKEEIEKGGDWERRNKLKVFEGIHLMLGRNFNEASKLFLGVLSTFPPCALLSFDRFIFYACLLALLCCDRATLKEQASSFTDCCCCCLLPLLRPATAAPCCCCLLLLLPPAAAPPCPSAAWREGKGSSGFLLLLLLLLLLRVVNAPPVLEGADETMKGLLNAFYSARYHEFMTLLGQSCQQQQQQQQQTVEGLALHWRQQQYLLLASLAGSLCSCLPVLPATPPLLP